MDTTGVHLIVDLWHVSEDMLNNKNKIKRVLLQAAREANATVIRTFFHKFSPTGVSGVFVIAESHISIHTFPEAGYAGMDIYTCGDRTMPTKAMDYIIKAFGVNKADCRADYRRITRGISKTRKLVIHEVKE